MSKRWPAATKLQTIIFDRDKWTDPTQGQILVDETQERSSQDSH